MQNSLTLWFFDAENPQLGRVSYSSPVSGLLISTRGNQISVPIGAVTGVFPWSRAVRGLCVLALRTYLHKSEPQVQPMLVGTRGSLAVALDSAIAKEPQWLLDLFGADSDGRSAARRLIKRDNPESKRPGPVAISFGQHFITDTTIEVFLEGERIGYSQVAALIQVLLQSAPASPRGFDSPNENRRIASITTQSSCSTDATGGADSHKAVHTTGGSFGSPTLFKPPVTTSKILRDASCNIERPVVIADSDLLVIKSVSIAWRLEEMLRNQGIACKRVTWSWSDQLLEALNSGLVDIAIYNTHSALRFIEGDLLPNITVVCDWGNSMGGKNFYLLARKDSSWPCSGLDTFLERLRKGATIIVPEQSDMIANVLSVLDTSEDNLAEIGVEIVSVPVSQGLEVLDVNPEALLIHGQNVRFKARFRGLYNEVLNYDCLPSHLQQTLLKNSSNSLLISNSCLNSYPKQTLLTALEAARSEFFTAWTNSTRYPELVKELVENERKYGIINEDEITYVVKQILYETYRFGKPGA